MYKILPYSYNQANRLGVSIFPSKHKGKKIDVYKNNKYICSVGALGMNDYPTYIKENGIEYASQRRKLYHIRHKKDNVAGTTGWYALNLLW
jgi:hypothetical protein